MPFKRYAFDAMEMRKITPMHKEKVIQISKEIWEGDDYIPEIFDKWVSDAYGEFVGLFKENELIAFGKMTYLTPTDVWLEGLRKHQQSDIKGVAKYFTEYYIEILSNRRDITTVRFATYFSNYGSIIPAEKCGFQRILTCSLKNFEIGSKKKSDIPDTITADISYDEFKEYILNTKYLRQCRGLLSKGWVVYDVTDQLLSEFFTKRQFVVCIKDGKIKGIILFCDIYYSDSFWISLFEAEDDLIRDSLLKYAENFAIERKKTTIQMLIPDDDDLMKWSDQRGFSSWERNNDFIVFDLPLKILKG